MLNARGCLLWALFFAAAHNTGNHLLLADDAPKTDNAAPEASDAPEPLPKLKAGDRVDVDTGWSRKEQGIVSLIQPDGITVKLERSRNKPEKYKWSQISRPGDTRTYEAMAPNYKPIKLDSIRVGDEIEYFRDGSWSKGEVITTIPTGMLISGWASRIEKRAWNQLRKPGSTVTLDAVKDQYKPATPPYDVNSPNAPKIGDKVEFKTRGDRWEPFTLEAVLEESMIGRNKDKFEKVDWANARPAGATRSFEKILPKKSAAASDKPGAPAAPGAPDAPAAPAAPAANVNDEKEVPLPKGFTKGDRIEYLSTDNSWNPGTLIKATKDWVTVELFSSGQEDFKWSQVRNRSTYQTLAGARDGRPTKFRPGEKINYTFGGQTREAIVKSDKGASTLTTLENGRETTIFRSHIISEPAKIIVPDNLVQLKPPGKTVDSFDVNATHRSASSAPTLSPLAASRWPTNLSDMPVPVDGSYSTGRLLISDTRPIITVAFDATDDAPAAIVQYSLSGVGETKPYVSQLTGASRILDVSLDGKQALAVTAGYLSTWAFMPNGAVEQNLLSPFPDAETLEADDHAWFITNDTVALHSPSRKTLSVLNLTQAKIQTQYKSKWSFKAMPMLQRQLIGIASSGSSCDLYSPSFASYGSLSDSAVSPDKSKSVDNVDNNRRFKVTSIAGTDSSTLSVGQASGDAPLRWIHPDFVLQNNTDVLSLGSHTLIWRFTNPQPFELSPDGTAWRLVRGDLGKFTLKPTRLITPQIIEASQKVDISNISPIKAGQSVDITIQLDNPPAGAAQAARTRAEAILTQANLKVVNAGPATYRLEVKSSRLPSKEETYTFRNISTSKDEKIKVTINPINITYTLTQGSKVVHTATISLGPPYLISMNGSETPQACVDRIIRQAFDQQMTNFDFQLGTLFIPTSQTTVPTSPMFP